MLVAAGRFAFVGTYRAAQGGVPCYAVRVIADKDGVVVFLGFIQKVFPNTGLNKRPVNSSPGQILNYMNGVSRCWFRQQQHLLFLLRLGSGSGRHFRRPPQKDAYRIGERIIFDFYQIVQRRSAADPAREPIPLAVADLQAVMLSGTPGVA